MPAIAGAESIGNRGAGEIGYRNVSGQRGQRRQVAISKLRPENRRVQNQIRLSPETRIPKCWETLLNFA